MEPLTIKQLMTIPAGSPVQLAGGIVRAISGYQTGQDPNGAQIWSLQDLTIEDATGTIAVRIGNHPEITADTVGKILYFAAHRKAKGGLSGLKMDEEEYTEGGQVKKYRLLAVARSGDILTEEQFLEANKSTIPVPSAAQAQAEPQQEAPEHTGVPALPDVPVKKGKFQVTELRYERTVNTGNYCSEKMGVTIALEPGTKVVEALAAAKDFLARHMAKEAIPQNARVAA